ncbi:MAG TPA: 1-deoxy-D-xylulose-5-phosphate reductoisomerase [Candidatus Stackebrandtia faecavium]|nr:1-deoxy-D-xylulose-5-phosphate reductoisomerase [Candidatus Stackebrandtia faecavium]
MRDNKPVSSRDIVILGATGSIGVQAIDVVRRNADQMRIVGIGAGGNNPKQLVRQALDLNVDVVAVAKSSAASKLQLEFYAQADKRGYARGKFRLPKILAGPQAMEELAQWPSDLVLNGMTGSIGLGPTLSALRAGKTLALANKESLVAGGPLVRTAAKPGQVVPVDSEHSALAQCLRAGDADQVSRLILTASGGPFRGRTRSELSQVSLDEALAHPTWSMGPVVTINSATLVNKGLEVIETHEHFQVPYDDIDVVVHPQSVIHSMVEYIDGSTIAQASPPDMRLPIAHALSWPRRSLSGGKPVDWTRAQRWEFEPVDNEAFPAVQLARDAGKGGRCLPAIYNAANEECVAAFADGKLPFVKIVDTVADVLADTPGFDEPSNLVEVLEAERWARDHARHLITQQGR